MMICFVRRHRADQGLVANKMYKCAVRCTASPRTNAMLLSQDDCSASLDQQQFRGPARPATPAF